MTLVTFAHTGKYFGTQDVLKDVSFRIHEGDRIGLVGANGAGKTTLLRILLGEEEPTSGNVTNLPDLKIGYIPQIIGFGEGTVEEYILGEVRQREMELREAEAVLALVQEEDLAPALLRYQGAGERYEAAGGDGASPKAAAILQSLGLPGAFPRKVASLSGGEKNILALAKALLLRPDLLVLDEPGNHLDYIGLAWLEKYLQGFPGALLIVSHNRYLLDRTTEKTFELQGGRLTEYDGNYSRYRMTKLGNAVSQQADYKADRKKLDRLEALVKRFEEIARRTADPAWGKRLHSRRTQLEKAKDSATEKPEGDAEAVRISLTVEKTRADIAVSVKGYSKSFGDRVLFRDAALEISCGERVALVGPNGSGKSTFIRDLLSGASWDNPAFRIGPSLKVGYCAQNQEVLDHDKSILEEFLGLGAFTEKEVFTQLSRFLFTWQDLSKKIGNLSGGEKNRLQLARVIMLEANFLILDEPTNHMDIPSREALEDALSEYEGTVLAVTHDRYFLDKIATTIVEIDNYGFTPFYGNFSEFWAVKQSGLRSMEARVETRARQFRRPEALTPGKPRVRGTADTNLEGKIMELEQEKGRLERDLSAAFSRGDYREGRRLSGNLEELGKRIEGLYEKWGKGD